MVALTVVLLGGLLGVGFVLSGDEPGTPSAPAPKSPEETAARSDEPVVRAPFPGYARGTRVTLHVVELGTLTDCDLGTMIDEAERRFVAYYANCPEFQEQLKLFWVQVYNFSEEDVTFRLEGLDVVDELGDVYPPRPADVVDALPSTETLEPRERVEGWLPVRVVDDFSPVEVRLVEGDQILKITFDHQVTVEAG